MIGWLTAEKLLSSSFRRDTVSRGLSGTRRCQAGGKEGKSMCHLTWMGLGQGPRLFRGLPKSKGSEFKGL